jgi:ribA/ribD-fused uncharacterized protein
MSRTTPSGVQPLDFIGSFRDEYAFLSNFAASPLTWEGIRFPTAEAAFAAGKTLDRPQRERIACARTPREAKRLGRTVTLRPRWDEAVRYQVMRQVLEAKFADPALRDRLARTGTALLVEGDDWCDQEWGCCGCMRHRAVPGENTLGRFLMNLRAEITDAPADRWTRVACTGHRHVPADSRDWVREELRWVAETLRAEYGTEIAISGGAMGPDLWWADAAHEAGARVWLYQPHPEQTARWPAEWQRHHRRVRDLASRVATLGTRYTTDSLFTRNEWMVRDCEAIIAVIDPERTRGGTHHAAQFAHGRRPIIRIDIRHRRTTLVRPEA